MRHLFTFMLRIREQFKSIGKELNWLVEDERVIMFFILPTGPLNGTKRLSADRPKTVLGYFLISIDFIKLESNGSFNM